MAATRSKIGRVKKTRRKNKSASMLPRFNYGNRCDYPSCGKKVSAKVTIWSYVNRLGRMDTRCKRHLKKPPTKNGPRPSVR